jgi:hypothetical protein
VAVLPRLDDLVRFPDLAADNAYRILYCDPIDRRIHKQSNKIQSTLLASVCNLLGKMASAAYGQVCAWRVGNHQIPFPAVHEPLNRSLVMVFAVVLARQQVATPGVMPHVAECLPNPAAVLTCH